MAALVVEGLCAGYGEARVLDRVSFTLEPGRALALLGRNGTGKTTLVDTLMGLTTLHAGTIRLGEVDLTRLPPQARARAGLGWVPQERDIFASLTVEENMTAVALPGAWTVARVYDLFPRLRERRATMGRQLSGGEQQMLALGRALVLNPSVLLLDEPLEGLAPIIAEELLAALGALTRARDLAIVIVEQKARKILATTQDAIVLDRGAVVHQGPSAALLADDAALERTLGVKRA